MVTSSTESGRWSPYPPKHVNKLNTRPESFTSCEQANSFIKQGNFVSALQYLYEAMYLYPSIKNLEYLRAFRF